MRLRKEGMRVQLLQAHTSLPSTSEAVNEAMGSTRPGRVPQTVEVKCENLNAAIVAQITRQTPSYNDRIKVQREEQTGHVGTREGHVGEV
jgi:hypothetical protein